MKSNMSNDKRLAGGREGKNGNGQALAFDIIQVTLTLLSWLVAVLPLFYPTIIALGKGWGAKPPNEWVDTLQTYDGGAFLWWTLPSCLFSSLFALIALVIRSQERDRRADRATALRKRSSSSVRARWFLKALGQRERTEMKQRDHVSEVQEQSDKKRYLHDYSQWWWRRLASVLFILLALIAGAISLVTWSYLRKVRAQKKAWAKEKDTVKTAADINIAWDVMLSQVAHSIGMLSPCAYGSLLPVVLLSVFLFLHIAFPSMAYDASFI